MELTSIMQELSFRKDPRVGQRQVLEAAITEGRKKLNAQLPTGYGKTFTACAVYSVLKRLGLVNRLLFIVPTRAQLEQFNDNGHDDLKDAGVTGSDVVCDISFFGTQAISKHRKNQSQTFVTTVQSAGTEKGAATIGKLMETGRWMVVVDEYHHYGVDLPWANAVEAMNYSFRLAMSATPNRPEDDGAFGSPDVVVSYRKAVGEGAVKELCGHSYVYKIDAINENGDVISYTTSELVDELGETPEKMEKAKVKRNMRWSPKYVSPLVSIPLDRMHVESIRSGQRLQAIIGAMCVSHAKLVYEQVSEMYPELSVDWVGTGKNGRGDEENREVLKRFCPKKDGNGRRNPILDVLVHVGMAGEGLDSINVSEVIHLNPANINNSNNQENGRAARFLNGVIGNINYDSSSPYNRYSGSKIMDAMDHNEPSDVCGRCKKDPCECSERKPGDEVPELPEEPSIYIADMEVITIHSEGVKQMSKALANSKNYPTFTKENMLTEESLEIAMELLKMGRAKEAEKHNEKAIVEQWREAVDRAVSALVGRVIRDSTHRAAHKSLAGELKKKINGAKKKTIGSITNDIEVLRKHYQWVTSLEKEIISGGVPSWLL